MKAIAAVVLAFIAVFPVTSFGAQVSQIGVISSALDRARDKDEIIRQVARLDILAKSAPSPEVWQQLGRALYLLGEGEKNDKLKLDYLGRSLSASKTALKENPSDAVSLYWKAMALLQEADVVGGLKALSDVREALRELRTVSGVAPKYDEAGAYRSRGKVLIEAPGWSLIGDKKKGLELLVKAVNIAPANLVNRLYLAQAYIKNGMKANARTELQYILSAPAKKGDAGDALTKAKAAKLLKEAS